MARLRPPGWARGQRRAGPVAPRAGALRDCGLRSQRVGFPARSCPAPPRLGWAGLDWAPGRSGDAGCVSRSELQARRQCAAAPPAGLREHRHRRVAAEEHPEVLSDREESALQVPLPHVDVLHRELPRVELAPVARGRVVCVVRRGRRQHQVVHERGGGADHQGGDEGRRPAPASAPSSAAAVPLRGSEDRQEKQEEKKPPGEVPSRSPVALQRIPPCFLA